ncbi:Tn3 family transposase [Streptomyces sp. OE57]|uniref:Tn3 family transposase n=1 Tax=Streptomyces lacaronensis TaxID=3379885 RepID=UPI0039B78B4A
MAAALRPGLRRRAKAEGPLRPVRADHVHQGHQHGPYEAAKHIPGVIGHELSLAANRHFSIALLNEAIADVVNAHAELDISQVWGDGSIVAADGTHM